MSEIRHAPVAVTSAEPKRAGDVIDRHRHDGHQLIYVSTGVLAIGTPVGTWVASAERAVWIPAGVWHEHRFYGRSSFHTVGFAAAQAPLRTTSPTVIAVDGLLRELLIACTDPALPPGEVRRLRAVLGDRLRRSPGRALTLPAADDARLADACRLVRADLSRPRSTSWLARQVGSSERTLARLFRSEFGMTYPQWRNQARIFQAMIELAEGATVTATAHRCGWSTTSAFIDSFTRTTGRTPGSCRATADPGAG